ncbi:lamin tail domain-containing protein [Winogradskyella eximia]|uniref:lamin tail domain-containing protein n=1 Tax=Winogradskyella eximia TaxID=262006 RepID=UPI0024926D6F|nr:Calx-beta domain-containing protein [Winogradskyella eximia]
MKNFYTFLFALMITGLGFAQGTETFSNIPTIAAYNDGNWTGDDGSTWEATKSRSDQTIDGESITMNDDEANTYIQSGTISGGIGDITITTQRKFGGGSGSLDVLINGSSIGTIPYSGLVQTTTISGINVTGDFVIRINNNIGGSSGGGADRVAVDNITWTAAGPTCTPPAVQASTFTTLSANTTDVNIEFTRGYGDDVLVVMKEGSAVDADPTNGTSYTANSVFNGPGASEIGTGNYVVFNGNNGTSNPGVGGASLNISVFGLNPSTTYHLAIYEYYTADTCYNLTAFTGDFTTATATTVQFTSTSASVAESAGTYDLVIEIANEDIAATTFDVVLTSGDASDIDSYTTQSETFPGSSTTDITVTITVTDDAIIETDEVFTFEIQNVAGGNSAAVGTNNAFDLTITNNDFPTTVEFVSSSDSVSEGDGTYDLEFTIANEDAAATSFDVVLIGGTGDASDIATYTTQTVTFPGGTSTNQTATLTITDDIIFEGDESLIFEIQNVAGGNSAVIGTESSFTLTMTDNDTPPPCNSIFSDDFTGGLSQWSNTGDWTTSSGELKHDLSSIESESYIYTDLGVQDYSSTDYEWEFCISNGNWDPSSGNKFAFNLFSDASNLISAPTGYAVGVNQSDTSDLIRLYSVNNGVYTSIIASTFDWNSNDDVCIRVTRSASGAWELFYNDDGAGEVSVGTTTNTTYTSGNYLGATFDFSSSRAGLLYIDDINICKVDVVSLNDTDTEVAGTTAVAGATITAANSTTSGTAFDVLGFEVEDKGTVDVLSTNITTMRFVPGPNNTADWTDHIQGVTLLDGNLVTYSPTTTITDSEIILTFASPIQIADGTSLEFLLGLYLNETAIVDGSVIQLQINGTSSGFDADLSGSDFADPFLLGDIVGNNMTIDVDASELRFLEQPTNVFVNTIMTPSVTVAYTDVNGNIDVDYSGVGLGFDISLVGGSFDIGATTTVEAINGIATFDNLIFDTVDTAVVLTASDDSTFISGTYDSNAFDVIATPIGTTDLFFSEYVEGSSNNKYLEIYNGTDEVVTLTDYSIELYSNGDAAASNTEDFTVGFPATLGIGEVIVLENASASIYLDTAYSSPVCNFNGDDAIVLKKGGVIIDIIGNIGCDPGSQWTDGLNDTSDRTIIRNDDICEGVTTDPSGCTFPTLGTDWTGYAQDYIADLGSHTANCGTPVVYTYSGSWLPSDPNGTVSTIDIIIIESGNAIISSNTEINTLTVNPGASLTVSSSITLTINSAEGMLLNSTSTNYSSLILDGTITGTVKYNRYVNNNDSVNGNDLISAPLSGQAFNTFIANNPNIRANPSGPEVLFGGFDNDSSTNPFELWNDTDTTPLTAGKGYRSGITEGEASNLVTFEGTVSNGLVQTAINQGTVSKLNLIGNPFPSYLDAQQFLSHNASLLDPSALVIYGYNDSTDGTSAGDYTIISALLNTGMNIAPGQGFFVASGATGGNIEFTTTSSDMRLAAGGDDFIAGRDSSVISNLKLNLSNANANFITDIFFTEFSTLGLDPGYDASLLGGSAPSFALYSELIEDNTGVPFAVQALGKTDYLDVTIPLGVNANQGEQITFSINETNLPSTIDIYLDDTVENTSTLLNTSDYVMTPIANLSGVGRFYLRFSESTLSTSNHSLDNISIYTNANDKTAIIAGQLLENTTAYIYDIQGRVVSTTILDSTSRLQSLDTSHLTVGIYVIQLTNGTQNKTQKVIIR